MTYVRWFSILILVAAQLGCGQDEQQISDKARLEGKATAEAEMKAQIDGLQQLAEKARTEGRAQAEAELQVQIENQQKLIEKARTEGRASAEAELAVQNGNLFRRAAEMEEDLVRRQRFFQATRGTYEGTMTTDQATFNIRMTLVPSLPPYSANRTRTLDELTHDLTNLYFNVQVVQWNPKNTLSAVGCRVQSVRPDIVNGLIQIASENCPNFYSIKIADPSAPDAKPDMVAASAREGRLSSVPELRGEVQPTTNASVYKFSAVKISNN